MTRDPTDNAPLVAITAQRDRLLEIITSLGAVSSSPATTPELMRETVRQVMDLTRSQGSVLEFVDGAQLEYRAVAGSVSAYLGLRLDAATSLSGRCVAEKRIMYSRDTDIDPRVDSAACRRIGVRSMLVVPLFRGADAIGVLKAVSASPDAFDSIDEYALSLFSHFIGGVIARQSEADRSAVLAAQMEMRALRDDLTGLPNRAAWLDALHRGIGRARRSRAPLAVMYLDLDGFKAINDTHGHAAGDRVLQGFAIQLRGCVREVDLVARLSGDEFAVMLEGFHEVERDVVRVMDSIAAAARAGTTWGDTVLRCMPSIGVAFQSGPEFSADTLMRAADEAMYRAKKTGTRCAVTDCSGAVPHPS
ncbi:MAG TPA: sensor domain-containing diguanylate cyclase [Luteimonas sp.]|nr:sensor domain-containing diguanylate cyclase [Luteimonas sp.]